MREVSDDFLLNLAEVSATLIGLFLVGVFFYVETGFRRLGAARETVEPYFRAGTRIVLLLYALPLGLSLTLVTLGPTWNRALFLILSLLLLAANIDSLVHVRSVTRLPGSTLWLVTELLGTAAVLALVVTPWALGGLHPRREHLVWALLLSFGAGFLSVGALVMSTFESAEGDASNGGRQSGSTRSPARRLGK
jgi:hypothetical protein